MKKRINEAPRALKVKSHEQRLVSGVVYEPDFVDSQDEFASAEEIEKAAHNFLVKFRTIKRQHEEVRKDIDLVESFIAPVDMKVNEEIIKKGSWVITVKIHSDEIWEDVKNGNITGFSMGGTALAI